MYFFDALAGLGQKTGAALVGGGRGRQGRQIVLSRGGSTHRAGCGLGDGPEGDEDMHGNCFLERRNHARFRVNGHAFASSSMAQFGQVMDLGRGGFRFIYVDNGKWPAEAGNMDIVFFDQSASLEHVVCRTVWDRVVANSISGLTVRERGLAFGPMTEEQSALLSRFLWEESSAMASCALGLASFDSEAMCFSRVDANAAGDEKRRFLSS